jgi:diguanylate cyclase (GGDEF)-like protein
LLTVRRAVARASCARCDEPANSPIQIGADDRSDRGSISTTPRLGIERVDLHLESDSIFVVLAEPLRQMVRRFVSAYIQILLRGFRRSLQSPGMQDHALGILAEMTQRLVDDSCVEAALQRIADTALQVTAADHASVRLCRPDGRLEVAARSGVGSDRPPPPFRTGQGVLGWVAETGQMARIADSRHEPRFVERRERGYAVGSLLSLPVRGAGNTLAVLSVSSPQCDAFGERDEAVGRLLASAAAHALRTAELRQLALTDSQTLAYNRRYLLPRLRQELERAQRQGEPLSLMMIDLDHFKHVNDHHGHAAGDAVLAAFADRVRGCVRGADVMFRRGGEEFVLLMPATDEHQALIVAERVRGRLAQEPLQARRGVLVVQTVSIGLATWDGVEAPEALEERADLAMYEAKRRGRNRVVVATRCAPPNPGLALPSGG